MFSNKLNRNHLHFLSVLTEPFVPQKKIFLQMLAMKIGMEFLILLLHSSLLFLNVATLVIDENLESNDGLIDGSRVPSGILPLRYEVRLELHDVYSDISSHGECNITILVNPPTQEISFHVNILQVQNLNLEMKSTTGVVKPANTSHDNETDTHTLFFDEKISGYFVLYFSFINVEDSNEGNIFRPLISEEDTR